MVPRWCREAAREAQRRDPHLPCLVLASARAQRMALLLPQAPVEIRIMITGP